MTTLRAVIEEQIARAFLAGAQWASIWRDGQDSAAMGRELRKWEQDPNYIRLLRDQQRQAVEVIPRALLDIATQTTRQGSLF